MLSMLQMGSNDHLWFLKALFLIFLIVIPLTFFIKRQNFLLLIIITALTILVHTNVQFPINELNIIFKYLPYFMLGFITRKIGKEISVKASLLLGVALFLFHFINFYLLNNLSILGKEYLTYLIATLGIYAYYFLSIFLSQINLSAPLWKKIQIIDASPYSIYLFHVIFLYIVLYLNSYFEIENSWFRIIGVFLLGMILPIYIQRYFSQNKYIAILFSIKYQAGKI